MDDFKTLESSMATQMGEMHEMIAQLMQANKSPIEAPPEAPTSLNQKPGG
jgi:hypothetical protein